MGIRKLKPVTPTQRFRTVADFSEITRVETDDVDNSEANQAALIEIEEYLRVGAVLIRDDLDGTRSVVVDRPEAQLVGLGADPEGLAGAGFVVHLQALLRGELGVAGDVGRGGGHQRVARLRRGAGRRQQRQHESQNEPARPHGRLARFFAEAKAAGCWIGVWHAGI